MTSLSKKILIRMLPLMGVLGAHSQSAVLHQPTGQYAVGVHEYHWINDSLCPDPSAEGTSAADFSATNARHCHELTVRIYYPTNEKQVAHAAYPAITPSLLTQLSQVPGVTAAELKQLKAIKSVAVPHAPMIAGKRFPTILFSPGSGAAAQLYENSVTELVSHGYVVVGINSFFNNGEQALPNGHAVGVRLPASRDAAAKRFVLVQQQDIVYTLHKIKRATNTEPLLASLKKSPIGMLGHSMGARAALQAVAQSPGSFQALVTLDLAFYQPKAAQPVRVPTLHLLSAYWPYYFGWRLTYCLSSSDYLVLLSPQRNNTHYSFHQNYTDYSTLQSMPALKKFYQFDHQQRQVAWNLQVMEHAPRVTQQEKWLKPTYLLIKQASGWQLSYYQHGRKQTDIPLDNVAGLASLLAPLSAQPLAALTPQQRIALIKCISEYRSGVGTLFGSGDPWIIMQDINSYLLAFFDMQLKHIPSKALKHCQRLSPTTVLYCGPRAWQT